jgi:hypothetical protein
MSHECYNAAVNRTTVCSDGFVPTFLLLDWSKVLLRLYTICA